MIDGPGLEYINGMVVRFILTVFTMLSILGLGSLASAEVNIAETKRLELPAKVGAESLTETFGTEVLPNKLAADETSQTFLSKVADNSLNLYWKHSPLRYTTAGQAVETAEKKLNVEASYKDDSNIDHHFNFKVLAMQALAKIQYTGWVNAALNYDLKAARAAAEVTEALSDKSDIVLSHEVSKYDHKSGVSLKWKW
ncbi:hypothetical protein CIK05_14390 [Bdellovibrio sp. qaytius]|nr:hypothetical protein CIK05_14390 [Bdellovibrio sp. qaytius]